MKKYFCALLIVFFSISASVAQHKYTTKSKGAIKNYQMALNKYGQQFYNDAVLFIDEAIQKDSMFIEAYLLKADWARLKGKIEVEIDAYYKILSIDSTFFIYTYYNLGEALYLNGEYRKAKKYLNTLLSFDDVKSMTQKRARHYISRCNFAIELMKHPVEFAPKNLGNGINDNYNQYWPSLSLDGKTLIYTVMLIDSSKQNMFGQHPMQEDFYVSNYSDGCWQKGKPIGPPLNTRGNEGAHKLSADGNLLVFTGCNRPDGFGACDVYISVKVKDGWSEPMNAGRFINTPFSEKQPSISPDGRYLFFSSNRPGGKGNMDIWFVERFSDGSWSEPENMGEKINTKGNEVSPFIHPDNQTFYFSSDGLFGMGNKDIFYVKRDSNNQWGEPHNLGYPINTNREEIGLVVDANAENAYYSTNSNSTSIDIYSFLLPQKAKPKPVSYIKGIIYDETTKKPLPALVQLININSGDTVMEAHASKQEGSYLVCLPSGVKYVVNVNYPGYLFYSDHFNVQDTHSLMEPLVLDIPLTPAAEGKKVVLNNIFFKHDSFELLPESEVELGKICNFIKLNASLRFEISGHTDNVGNADYNLDLSEKRAKAVYDYLLNKGINKMILEFKGYGSNNPIQSNETKEGRSKNRRTELKIIGAK